MLAKDTRKVENVNCGSAGSDMSSPYHVPRDSPCGVTFLLSLYFFVAPPAFALPAAMTAEETYNLGQKRLKAGLYVKALEQFNRVRTYFRDDPFALKAELAIADIHYKKQEWDAARISYEDFMRAHPRYPELDYVVYQLGLTVYKKAPMRAARDQTWTKQAVNTWAGFSARFPESTHAAEAESMLGKARARLARKEVIVARFYQRRKAWNAVVRRIEPMLTTYPESPDRAEALALLSVAYTGEGKTDQARAAEDKLASEFPGSIALRRLKLLKR